MDSSTSKYGARIYALPGDMILIKQTIKSGPRYTDEYIVDTRSDGSHIEFHVEASDNFRIGDAIRRALSGTL